MKPKGLTATVVFESSAVNRDEKLGGNIASIKKLSRSTGTYSYMSRAFVRHHMFETLYYRFNWQLAPVTKQKDNDKEVLQFKFPDANIVFYPEMDVFGFMCTSPFTVTRKAPLGITKAISLEPWQGDMAFYANHDMVKRARQQDCKVHDAKPNIFSKEEHYSHYRVSFTLDLCRLGVHDLYYCDKPKELQTWLEALPKADSAEVSDKVKDKSKHVGFETYYRLEKGGEVLGFVGEKKQADLVTLRFMITDSEYKKRLTHLVTVIKEGLMMHSSTEDYGLSPCFLIMSTLKIPVPVFNSAVNLSQAAIQASSINQVLGNEYILDTWYWGYMPIDGTLHSKVKPWDGVGEVVNALFGGE